MRRLGGGVLDVGERTLNGAVAAILRGRKSEKLLTYEQLAERTGMSVRTVKRLLHDQTDIALGHLVKFADAFDTTAYEIMQKADQSLASKSK